MRKRLGGRGTKRHSCGRLQASRRRPTGQHPLGGGGRPSFARMDSVGGGGVVAEIFRNPYSVGGGGSSRKFPGSIFGGVSQLFPLTPVTDTRHTIRVFFPVNCSNRP